MWDKEKIKLILRRLIDKYQAQIVFNIVDTEKELALQIHRSLDYDKHVFITSKADSLPALCVLMANCDFFFGNEGGPRHISQALGIPSYAIFPPNVSKNVWLPRSQTACWGISPDDFDVECKGNMSRSAQYDLIDVDRVWQEIDSILSTVLFKNGSNGRTLPETF